MPQNFKNDNKETIVVTIGYPQQQPLWLYININFTFTVVSEIRKGIIIYYRWMSDNM